MNTQPRVRTAKADVEQLNRQFGGAQAEINRLRDENARLKAERDAAQRGILELYHLELITMSRARELMGFDSIVPVREMYRKLRPHFDRELGDMGYARAESAGREDV